MANSVGRALLLPGDMQNWTWWEDDALVLGAKRDAVLVCIV